MPLPLFNRYASFPEPSDDWESGPVYRINPGRPAAPGTMFQSPLERIKYPRLGGEGGADRGYSPQTVNAVSASMKAREEADVPLYPTDFRRGYDQGVAGRTQSVRVPDRSPYPGALERASVGAGDAYPLPRFNAMSSDDGGGDRGLFRQGFEAKYDEYGSQAEKLFSSGGLVDNWLGRQRLKARSRLVADAERRAGVLVAGRNAASQRLATNANVMRAQNEVPLAQLSDITQRRGQDLTTSLGLLRNETDRYGIDTQASTSRENSERSLLPHLADITYGTQVTNAMSAGDLEGAGDISEAFGKRNPRIPKEPHFEITPDQKNFAMIGPNGLPLLIPIAEMQKRIEKQRANEKALDLYGK